MRAQLRVWLVRLAVTVGVGLPAFLCFNFVYRFAVDAPFWDQWELVPMLDKWASGTLSFHDLLSQHNEHRIFFPRIVMLLLAAATRWDTRYEIWFNFLLLLGVGAVLFFEHLKSFGSSSRAAAAFAPCAWLIFTLRQENNLLWGWQLQITLCAIGLCGACALLCRADLSRRAFAGAIASAVLCCFSFASGLAVWPAGVTCLIWRMWTLKAPKLRAVRWRNLAVWCGAGILSTGLYLFDYAKPPGHPVLGYFLEHPGAAVRFFLMQLGGSLATELDLPVAAAMGAALVGALACLAVATRRGWLDAEKASLGVPLISFTWATAAMVTVGRVGFLAETPNLGPGSRYTTLTLLGVVGLYRCCLALRPESLRSAAAAVVAVMIFLGVYSTLDTAYPMATQVRRERSAMRQMLVEWRGRPDGDLQTTYPVAAIVRERAPVLERLKTSVFRDPAPVVVP